MTEMRLHDFLAHIDEAATHACSYLEGLSKADFFADKRTQQAVFMNLIVIGEAAAKIIEQYPRFAAKRSEIPWIKMRGMRNRMAHGYFDINRDIVWETVTRELPLLIDLIRPIGADEDGG